MDHRLSKSCRNLSMEATENNNSNLVMKSNPNSNTTSPTTKLWTDMEDFSAFLNDNTHGFMCFSSQLSRQSNISSGSSLSNMSTSRPTSIMPTPSRRTSVRPRSQRPKTLCAPNIFEQSLPCDVRTIRKKCFDICFVYCISLWGNSMTTYRILIFLTPYLAFVKKPKRYSIFLALFYKFKDLSASTCLRSC